MKILVDLNENELAQLEDISHITNARTRGQSIRNAIAIAHKEVMPPAYVRPALDPQAKARKKISTKEEQANEERKIHLNKCELLNGQFDPVSNTCTYKTYRYINENIPPAEGVRTIPVSEITDEILNAQYLPEVRKDDIIRLITK